MNCEKHQNLLSDLIDGSLNSRDCDEIEAHLKACPSCAETRTDLHAIVEFCREHRGEYDAVPSERAMWLRISNTIEAELAAGNSSKALPAGAGWWFRLTNRHWHLSFPQFATSIAATVVVAVLATVLGMRAFNGGGFRSSGLTVPSDVSTVADRYRHQQQVIDYWNRRVEMNKARWSAQMRGTFEQNLSMYDATVNESMNRLSRNPHDEVSEDVLNAALSDKIALLKAFAEL
ncbi:MAG TPA: zf-HC2 domain-containing protein [Pyrinomonadaceae bacterium]|nr:zf-HC2 domain-containing protein [Pyrinomonadaceae bacterium]